jgi:hypothetical protein
MGELDPRCEQYREAGRRAVEFQLQFQRPDGGYIFEGYPTDAFHKQGYSWGLAGKLLETHRLLSWAKTQRLQDDGQLRDYKGDAYKHAWFAHGAHRLGRFDVSYPVIDFLVSSQRPGGGLRHFPTQNYCRSLSTCMAALAGLYAGQIEMAECAAEWALDVLEQQPDPRRFYFMTDDDGTLVTPKVDAVESYFIDCNEPKQVYWEMGLPLQLMVRLYQVTDNFAYLDHAHRYFGLHFKCADDAFTYTGSGKSALGAALLYQVSGDLQARDSAVKFADMLVQTQCEDGTWRFPQFPDETLYHLDCSSEFNVWLQEIANALAAGDLAWGTS